MKKIFIDTEFTALSQSSELISLAMVSECGKTFYAIFDDYDTSSVSDFVKENVITHLNFKGNHDDFSEMRIKGSKDEIVPLIKKWLSQFSQVQMWADVPHYDWVLFCQLFGGALYIPENIHYICMDLATLLSVKGYDVDVARATLLPPEDIPEDYEIHNALSDAQLGIRLLDFLLKK